MRTTNWHDTRVRHRRNQLKTSKCEIEVHETNMVIKSNVGYDDDSYFMNQIRIDLTLEELYEIEFQIMKIRNRLKNLK